jgi:hypothetical protein
VSRWLGPLGDRLRGNIRFSWYESGHKTFTDEHVVAQMASDLAVFYQESLLSERPVLSLP